jgi:hypothetical protein
MKSKASHPWIGCCYSAHISGNKADSEKTGLWKVTGEKVGLIPHLEQGKKTFSTARGHKKTPPIFRGRSGGLNSNN